MAGGCYGLKTVRYCSWAGGELTGCGLPQSTHRPGVSDKVNPSLSPESPCPRQAHLAMGTDPAARPTSWSQAPAEGEHCVPGASWPPLPETQGPQRRRHKEHHSLLIRLPLETGIPMQKACVLPDQTGERRHPPTPTDCLGRESVTRPGLCPFPRDTRTLYTSPYWRS